MLPASRQADRRLVGGYSIRWDEGRARTAYEQGWWVRSTLADRLRQAAIDTPERILIEDGPVRVDCRALLAQAETLARRLAATAPPGSVVSFMLPNWHEAAVVYLGATLAGMVAHPVLPSLRENELTFMLGDANARFIFVPAEYRRHDYVAMMERVAATLDDPPEVVVLRGDPGPFQAWEERLAADAGGALPELEADAVRMVMYTSGTTGTSKGVLHTHNSLHALLRQIGAHWRIEPGDCFLVPSPISHIGGSIYAFEAPLLLGVRAILMDHWDPEAALDLLATRSCTHIAGATPFLAQILASAQARDEHLPALKVFICGGASVPPSLIREAAAHFEQAVVTRVYGSTEVPVTTIGSMVPGDIEHAAETDGRPGIAEIKLEQGASTRPGEGEIRVRGPQMLAGYLDNGREVDVFDEAGFYRTGDLGRWVDDDYLLVSGRLKDVIIRQGENISPREVEDLLVGHPGIAEVAIVGVPDPKTGERACAVIVPASAPGPDVAALAAFLGELGVAKFKFPETVVFRNALPKNDAGKVLKHRIQAELAESGKAQ